MINVVPFRSTRGSKDQEVTGDQEPYRRLILHEWPENFSMPRNPGFLEQLLDNLDFSPRYSEFTVSTDFKGNSERKRATFYRNTKVMDILSRFPEYENVHLHKSTNTFGWFTDAELGYKSYCHVLGRTQPIEISRREYAVGGKLGVLSIGRLLDHLKLLCIRISPAFGYSILRDKSSDALFFQGGTAEISWDRSTQLRADELGDSENRHLHLTGKLHDVYELNVISNLHLENFISKSSFLKTQTTLGDWILQGNRGSLIKLNENVFAWVVPKSVRQSVREVLFNSGMLTTKIPLSE